MQAEAEAAVGLTKVHGALDPVPLRYTALGAVHGLEGEFADPDEGEQSERPGDGLVWGYPVRPPPEGVVWRPEQHEDVLGQVPRRGSR